jgi:hypothetical protein
VLIYVGEVIDEVLAPKRSLFELIVEDANSEGS